MNISRIAPRKACLTEGQKWALSFVNVCVSRLRINYREGAAVGPILGRLVVGGGEEGLGGLEGGFEVDAFAEDGKEEIAKFLEAGQDCLDGKSVDFETWLDFAPVQGGGNWGEGTGSDAVGSGDGLPKVILHAIDVNLAISFGEGAFQGRDLGDPLMNDGGNDQCKLFRLLKGILGLEGNCDMKTRCARSFTIIWNS